MFSFKLTPLFVTPLKYFCIQIEFKSYVAISVNPYVIYSTPDVLASQAFLISLLIQIYQYRGKTCCNVLHNEF